MNNIEFQLVTNKLSIKNNLLPAADDGEFTVAPRFERKIWMETELACVRLIIEIKNCEDNPFPFDIVVDLTGKFPISSIPEDKAENFLKYQAVRILLPYARAMLSHISADALVPPLYLPLMDPVELFKE